MASTSIEEKRAEIIRKREENKRKKEEAERVAEEARLANEKRLAIDPTDGLNNKLLYYEPDDPEFWERWGWKVALPNLIMSTFNLMLMFAIWKQWGSIVGGIKAAHKKDPSVYHFGYSADEQADWNMAVGTLGGVAGLSGAVHRTVNTFMVCTCGGRTVNFANCLIGCITMIITTVLLTTSDCSYAMLMFCALASGVGGGGFSSFMCNISYFFPKSKQGMALGIVGGLGNIGISVSQFNYWIFGSHGFCLADNSGGCNAPDLGGKYLFNVTLIWTGMLLFALPLSWKLMHNMPEHGSEQTARNPTATNFNRFAILQMLCYLVAGVGATVFILFAPLVRETKEIAIGRGFVMAALSSVACVVGLWLLYTALPAVMGEQLRESFAIFKMKDIVLLSMLYIMTFSSFLGYAATFPKLIKALYPFATPTDYTWMPPLLGSLARVVGGFLSDRFTGAYTTGAVASTMTLMTFLLGFVIRATMAADDPKGYFPFFVMLHAILFIATGTGNATVFKQIACLLEPKYAGLMLGWTGAMAAYGGAIFPTFFDASINAGINDLMYYIISGYYGLCLLINWRYMFWMGKPV